MRILLETWATDRTARAFNSLCRPFVGHKAAPSASSANGATGRLARAPTSSFAWRPRPSSCSLDCAGDRRANRNPHGYTTKKFHAYFEGEFVKANLTNHLDLVLARGFLARLLAQCTAAQPDACGHPWGPGPISAGTAGDAARWGGSSAVVGMTANPFGAHQAGPPLAGRGSAEGGRLSPRGRVAVFRRTGLLRRLRRVLWSGGEMEPGRSPRLGCLAAPGRSRHHRWRRFASPATIG